MAIGAYSWADVFKIQNEDIAIIYFLNEDNS